MRAGCLLPLMVSSLVQAADYYVAATGGSDSSAGTLNAPLATVQQAVRRVQAGDTIYVRAGRYTGDITIAKDGQPGRPITLRNYANEVPQLGTIYLGIHDKFHSVGWITIEGIDTNGGVRFWNGHDIVIRRNNIHDSRASGILGNGARITIVGTKCSEMG